MLYGVRDLTVWHGPFCPDGTSSLDTAGGVLWRGRKEYVGCFVAPPTTASWFDTVDRLLKDQAELQQVRPWAEDTWPGIDLLWLDPQPGDIDVLGYIHVRLAYREGRQVVSCMLMPTEASLRRAIGRAVLKSLMGVAPY